MDLRRQVARRRAKEQQVENMPHPLVMPEEERSELLAALDRELARLPEKYRLPVVLCELEGRSRKEAARQLGLPEGTLSSRLSRARTMLARRMAAHGPALTGASLTALFVSEAGAAVVPASFLVVSTVRAAGGVVSAGVVALSEGVLKAMLLTKIKTAALVLLLAASIGVGGVTLTYRTANAQTGPGPQTAAEAQDRLTAQAAPPEKYDLEALRLEVEALRAGLQATRERVKGLEAEVHALKAAESVRATYPKAQAGALEHNTLPTEAAASFFSRFAAVPRATPAASPVPVKTERAPDAPPALVPATPIASPPATAPPAPAAGTPAPGSVAGAAPSVESVPLGIGNLVSLPATKRADAEARVKAAAGELLRDPASKKGQDVLKQALEDLNRLDRLGEPESTDKPNLQRR
jgi:hypothetical protein